MDYTQYTAQDFATDDSFIRWIKTRDKETDDFWKEWLKLHPEKKEAIAIARQLIESIRMEEPVWTEEQQLALKNRIWARLRTPKPIRRTAFRKGLQWAAVFIGALILMTIGWTWLYDSSLVYQTGYGVTQEIRLPDSSKVILNANSRLQYRQPWWSNKRQVKLIGEAFFQVAKKADSSIFTIHSGGIKTEVLGTEFSIRSRRDTIQVVLTSGRVQLSPQKEDDNPLPIVMHPGELVEYADKKMLRKEEVDTNLYAGLRQHMLIFKKTSLNDVAKQVNDLYGYDLHFPSVLGQKSFTAKVPLTMDGLIILKTLIAESFDVKIIRETEGSIYFTEKQKEQ